VKIMPSWTRYRYVAKFSIFLIAVILIAGMVACEEGPAPTSEIWDWYDLDAIRNNPSGSYLLMKDIDSNTAGYTELASETANEGKGWEPIGKSDNRFTGSFDGQGYEISNLFISRLGESYVGLFGIVDEGGVVQNIGVVNANVTGEWYVGGLVGATWGTVSNSYSTSSVTGKENVGGLAGGNGGTVSNSHSTGSVSGDDLIGGLVGVSDDTVNTSHSSGSVSGESRVGGLVGGIAGIVSNSHSSASVSGDRHVGGLVGYDNGTVSNCHSTGSVTGDSHVGGLVGWNRDTVRNCYSLGSATGEWLVGGLVGHNRGTVRNSYSTSSVTGNEDVGGLVGRNYEGTVSNSFWDTETSGQSTSDGGTGETTEEMQSIVTFSGVGWNINAVANPNTRNPSYTWNIVDEQTYPFLSWEP